MPPEGQSRLWVRTKQESVRENSDGLAGTWAGVQGSEHMKVSEANSGSSVGAGVVGEVDVMCASFWARSEAREQSESQRWQFTSAMWPQSHVIGEKEKVRFHRVMCYLGDRKPVPTQSVQRNVSLFLQDRDLTRDPKRKEEETRMSLLAMTFAAHSLSGCHLCPLVSSADELKVTSWFHAARAPSELPASLA